MPSLSEILQAYAEGRRKQEFGPNYDVVRRLRQAQAGSAEAALADAPLRTQALEQRLERGNLSMDALRREAADYAERKRKLVELGLSGYDVAPRAMEYAEAAPDREQARETAATQGDILQRRLETMPTAEEASADRAATRAYRQGQAEYYSGGGRSGGSSGRYTGRPVSEEIVAQARAAALTGLNPSDLGLEPGVQYDPETGSFYKPSGAFGWGKETVQLSPQQLAMVHALTVDRLRAAGFSPEALAKAGLMVDPGSVAAAGPGGDECDPEGLGLGCE